ncbi:hypothetical protein [Alistipes indistinctus]|uniref:hypothetical protein n=1 Tax=Alistipes indistinctus TaxID=626932 RepID=UPI0015F22092|nr:hypothetical protein [Alistipes indistinctus]BCG54249.1 hypothetical protein AI2BBH_12950 [Alistipes indistinctus]
MSRKEAYTYRPGEPDRWADYRTEAGIVGYSWAMRRHAERLRRRARRRWRVRLLLWIQGIAAVLWLLKR